MASQALCATASATPSSTTGDSRRPPHRETELLRVWYSGTARSMQVAHDRRRVGRSRRLHAGHRLASKQTPAKPIPESPEHPGFRCHLSGFRHLSNDSLALAFPGPHPDASHDAFSSSLTTTVFSQRSTRWFGSVPPQGDSEGPRSSISRTAPHQGPVLHRPLLAFRTHLGTPQGSASNPFVQLLMLGLIFQGPSALSAISPSAGRQPCCATRSSPGPGHSRP
jgi:hypothetical protein